MKKLYLLFVCLYSYSALYSQLTIQVNSVPPNTPADEHIYIAGNFNNWDAGEHVFQLEQKNGQYSITFRPEPGLIEFKFTRGKWENVEGNETGSFQPNHTLNYTGGPQTINISILGWEDLESKDEHSTASDNVQVMDANFYIPQLDRNRRIWIYLPPDYANSGKHYPVLYLQDAQNLFDATSSFSGEWEIDETLNNLFEEGDYGCIVIGIENGGADRLNEYSPWSNPKYGGGNGEAYADFLAHTLKPYVDEHYRTLTGRAFTGVAGSSMGGIISMYTAVEYQDIFGKAGILSPAFWFSDSCYTQIYSTPKKQDLRAYFVAGVNESEEMVPDMMHVYQSLVDKGYDSDEMYFVSHEDGQHSEWFWAREFPNLYEWLFGDLIITVHRTNLPDVYIFPHQDDNTIHVTIDQPGYVLAFYSSKGKKILENKIGKEGNVNTAALPNGEYYMALKDARQNVLHIDKFIKQ